MTSRKTTFYALFALVLVGARAISRHEEEGFFDDMTSNDEFYINDDWGTMEVSGASISSLFEEEDDQMEFDPQDDFSVYGFSTETEGAEKLLPEDGRPPQEANPKDDEVDPKDWDMTVDRTVDDVHVSGLAFIGTDNQPESLDSSSEGVQQPEILDSTTNVKDGHSGVVSDKEFQDNDEDMLDEIEHKDAWEIEEDFVDDDAELLDYDLADEFDDKLHNIAVDDLEGIEEVYRDSDTESVLTDTDSPAGVEVKGQAVLNTEDESSDNYLLEVEKMEKASPLLSGSGMADEFFVTGQSVKVADDEYDTEFDDDEDSDTSEDLFVDATDRHEKAKIERLFEDSVAALEL